MGNTCCRNNNIEESKDNLEYMEKEDLDTHESSSSESKKIDFVRSVTEDFENHFEEFFTKDKGRKRRANTEDDAKVGMMPEMFGYVSQIIYEKGESLKTGWPQIFKLYQEKLKQEHEEIVRLFKQEKKITDSNSMRKGFHNFHYKNSNSIFKSLFPGKHEESSTILKRRIREYLLERINSELKCTLQYPDTLNNDIKNEIIEGRCNQKLKEEYEKYKESISAATNPSSIRRSSTLVQNPVRPPTDHLTIPPQRQQTNSSNQQSQTPSNEQWQRMTYNDLID
ncbi:unnamed protein product [Moneuplotes crassus]|uniref:Uncharacterized protein n=1 Tax=Euplotes crassus TaxID=5936 RepID=A0AAD1X943_EUPCR|nr:unnamed protein product [Moneuplotes crassus]